MRKALVVLTASMAWFGTARPAAAAEDRVRACYVAARQDLDARRLEPALAGFKRCLAMATTPKDLWQMTLAVGLTFDLLGRRRRAVEYYRWFAEDSLRRGPLDPKWAQRRQRVEQELERLDAALRERMARLSVASEPPAAPIAVDGQPIDLELTRVTPATVYLAPGDHVVTLERSDGTTHATTVRLSVGQVRELVVDLTPAPTPPPVAPTPSDPTFEIAGWSTFGLGAASVVAGAIVTGLTFADYDAILALQDRPPTPALAARDRELRARFEGEQVAYWTLYALGGAAVVTGIVLLLVAPDDPDPVVTPGPGGVSVRF